MRYLACALAALIAVPAAAQDYSEGSAAKKWNVFGVEKARFEAKVTDAVCALTGDCPADCGAGKRQMVVIRTDDDKMFLANKNVQPAFSGAAVDLAAYCGQTVTVDGLLAGDPEITPSLQTKLYQVQIVTLDGGEPQKTNRFTKQWAKDHPEAKGKGPWFRRDPMILERLKTTGYLGLGAEADATYAEDNF